MLTVRERRNTRYCERPGCPNPAMGSGFCSITCRENPTKPRNQKPPLLPRVPTPCATCGEVFDKYPTSQELSCGKCTAARKQARLKAKRAAGLVRP